MLHTRNEAQLRIVLYARLTSGGEVASLLSFTQMLRCNGSRTSQALLLYCDLNAMMLDCIAAAGRSVACWQVFRSYLLKRLYK